MFKNPIIFIFAFLLIFYSNQVTSANDQKMTPFNLKSTLIGPEFQYESDLLGGYQFQLREKWRNVSNADIENSVNILVFHSTQDSSESLTITITKIPPGKNFKNLDAKDRLSKSLLKKNISYSSIEDISIDINGNPAEIAVANLKNNKRISLILETRNNFLLTATIGSNQKKSLSKKELTALFENFKIKIPSSVLQR